MIAAFPLALLALLLFAGNEYGPGHVVRPA